MITFHFVGVNLVVPSFLLLKKKNRLVLKEAMGSDETGRHFDYFGAA